MQLSVHLFGAVWVAALLSFSLCQDNCRVRDGKPGQAGVSGRDGGPGQKGEKGEPGLKVQMNKEALVALKGDKGEDGPIGDIGAKGFYGLLGPPGPMGPPGNPGSSAGGGLSSAKRAAFTVMRKKNENLAYNNPVIFNQVQTNLNNDFNVNTGKFKCKVAGVYYFVFHSVSEGDLCLKLISKSKDNVSLLFCDYNQRTTNVNQVMSGGAVIELAEGNEVWLEPFKINGRNKDTNKMSKTETSLFSGFLIFASG